MLKTLLVMIMHNFPWNELEAPKDDSFITRRIYAQKSHDIFIARDKDKKNILVMMVKENYLDQINKYKININSIRIDVFEKSKDCFFLTVKLLDDNLLEVFDNILKVILSKSIVEHEEKLMIQSFLQQLKRWQKFMSSNQASLLSEEKIRGLVAELTLLSELLSDNPLLGQEVIEAWYGPDRLQHDFIFNNIAIEVKSISNLDKKSVTISSEYQLESNLNKLFLRVYSVLKSNALVQDTLNLNSLIDNIYKKLDVGEKICFDKKLIDCGYVPNEKYDDFNYRVDVINNYLVTNVFPKICSSQLDHGVINVRYDVDLNKIDKFSENLPNDIMD